MAVRTHIFCGISLFFLLVLSSCDNKQEQVNENAPEVLSEDNIASGDASSEQMSPGEEQNVVHFALARLGGPKLDPHNAKGDLELNLYPNIFEGLLKIKPDTGELIPALAESYEWITPEIVEFSLRQGVTFHNGEAFDAEAVKYSFERMAAAEPGWNWIVKVLPEFQKVEIMDPYRVRIHLSRHNSVFLNSARFFTILPPRYLEEHGTEYFARNPVGTGPFKVVKIDYNDETVKTIHMEKNENYWDKGKPYLDGLVYYFGMTQNEALEKLLNAEVDAMADLPVRNILDVRKAGLISTKRGQGLITWLYFNLSKYKKDSPLWDPRVRKALIHSIDFNRIKEVVYNNRASQNNQWAFPGIPGYSEDAENYSYDIDLSRKLLEEAGYKDGFNLQAYCDDVNYEESRILQSSFKAIGINVEFDVLDEATNNCFLGSRKNPDSPCHPMLEKYDFMLAGCRTFHHREFH